jgi:hypothetical protein
MSGVVSSTAWVRVGGWIERESASAKDWGNWTKESGSLGRNEGAVSTGTCR